MCMNKLSINSFWILLNICHSVAEFSDTFHSLSAQQPLNLLHCRLAFALRCTDAFINSDPFSFQWSCSRSIFMVSVGCGFAVLKIGLGQTADHRRYWRSLISCWSCRGMPGLKPIDLLVDWWAFPVMTLWTTCLTRSKTRKIAPLTCWPSHVLALWGFLCWQLFHSSLVIYQSVYSPGTLSLEIWFVASKSLWDPQ